MIELGHIKITPEEKAEVEDRIKEYEEFYYNEFPWATPVGGAERSEKKYGGRFENWTAVGKVVWGNLYDDPQERFREGEYIHTSYIVDVAWDRENEIGTIETRNTIYELGKKCP